MNSLVGCVLAIEGAPGVGKSTLLNKLSVLFENNGLTAITYPEEFFTSLLGASRNNPGKFAFANQCSMTMRRDGVLTGFAQIRKKVPCVALIDRSLAGDRCFVEYLREQGNCIDDEQALLYERMVAERNNEMSMIDFNVYLHAKPEDAYQRSKDMRKRTVDDCLPLEYFRDLERIHFKRFFTDPKTIVCDWSNFETARFDNLPNRIEAVVARSPIVFGQWPTHSGKSAGDYIVQSLRDLKYLPQYQQIYCTETVVQEAVHCDYGRDVLMNYRGADAQFVIAH